MATAIYGSHALRNLLGLNTTIVSYGENRLVADLRTSMNAHNSAVDAMLSPFMEFSDSRLEPYGASYNQMRVRGQRVDQSGAVDTQRARPGVSESNLGFPLDRWQYAWQFTRDFVETATPADAAVRILAIQQGDLDRIEYEFKNAFFNPANNLTWRDYLVDDLVLPVRRFANADGQTLPAGPGGITFNPATHQHYMGRAGGALAAADYTALINNVVEHGVAGAVQLWINMADEPGILAMSNFYRFEATELVVPNVPAGTQVMRAPGPLTPTINPPAPDNMAIGRWNAKYDVWTKPWVPAGYAVCIDTGKRPLRWRQRARPETGTGVGAFGRGTLRIVGEHEHFPLRAEWIEREFGLATIDRVGGAILYYGGTSYVMPTITLPAL